MTIGLGILSALELILLLGLAFRALKVSREKKRLQAVIDSSSIVSIIATDPEGLITLFNVGAERMLGYSAEDMVGKQTPGIFHLESEIAERGRILTEEYGRPIEGFDIFLVKTLETGNDEREWTYIRKDGSAITVVLAVTVLKDKKGATTGILGVAMDITERKRIEKALSVSEKSLKQRNEILNALMDNLSIGVFMVESPGGKPIAANRAAQVLLGRDRLPDASEENLTLLYRAHKPGSNDPYPVDEIPIFRGMRGESSHIEDMIIERPDGRELWLEVFGSPIRDADGQVWASLVHFHDITARKRAEEELIREKALTEAIFNSVPGMLYLYDLEGRLVRWNRKHELMTGYTAEELSRMRLMDWYKGDNESQKSIAEGLKTTLETGFGEAEADLQRKDGSVIPMYFTATPLTLYGQKYFVGLGIDISSRKRGELLMQLRLELFDFSTSHTLEELLRETLDRGSELTGSPIAYYHFVNDDQMTISLQTWSTRTLREFCKVQGLETHYPVNAAGVWVDCIRQRSPVIHNDYASLPHKRGLPEGHAPIIRDLAVPVLKNDRVVAIFGVGNKAGDYTEADVQIVSFLADVTWEIVNLKRTGEALRASEAKLTALFDSMSEMVALHELVFDEAGAPVNYRIEDCNGAYTRVTGIPRERAVGGLASVVYGTSEPPYFDIYSKVALTGEPYRYETYFPPMDKHFSVSVVSPAKNSFATVTTDISESKRIQAVIDAKNKELEQIVYVASHDLRSPLVNVAGYGKELEYSLKDIRAALEGDTGQGDFARLVRDELPDMDKSVSRIRSSATQMDRLLKGLLQLSRQGRAALLIEDVDMNRCLAQLVASMSFILKEQDVDLKADDLPPCRGDAVQLTQVFTNLINNAVKYRDPRRPPVIRVRGSVAMERAVYRVEDNGVGIAEAHLQHVFEHFHRLDPDKTEGEGIGLTIVRQALSRMYGEIRVESVVGEGSAFIVTMPSARGGR